MNYEFNKEFNKLLAKYFPNISFVEGCRIFNETVREIELVAEKKYYKDEDFKRIAKKLKDAVGNCLNPKYYVFEGQSDAFNVKPVIKFFKTYFEWEYARLEEYFLSDKKSSSIEFICFKCNKATTIVLKETTAVKLRCKHCDKDIGLISEEKEI
jgi:hypothetical protein